jgi:CRP-like cAMP-binding protein
MKKTINFDNFVSQYASEEWIFLIKNYLSLHSFKKNDRIFAQGDIVTGIYFINHGKVKVTSRYNLEDERILRLSKEGNILGHRSFYTENYSISATALTDTEVTFIPKDIFIKFLKGNPDFALHVLEFVINDLQATEERMKGIIHSEVIVRIANIICMLIDCFGIETKPPYKLKFTLSRDDIASYAATTYESVIRNLGKLDELNLIKLDNKSIIISDENALRKFIIDSAKKIL